jgi:MoxR-like ATPase
MATDKFSSITQEILMKQAREALAKNGIEAPAPGSKKTSIADPDFIIKPEGEELNAHAGIILYSDKFVNAKDYLDKAGLEDFDISQIIYSLENWPESEREFIPALDHNYVWQHQVTYPAVRALVNDLKVLVVGPTGSGKTDMYKNIAAICNQPYLRIGGRGDMETDTIFGKMVILPDGSMQYSMADFPRAFRDGWLIALDEPWKLPANITMAWQRVFERGGILQLDDMTGELKDKQIKAHKRTRMVLCDNVVGTGDGADRYAATMIQDSSTLNRIDLVLELNYLNPDAEVAMLMNRFNFIPEDKAKKSVQLANLIRDAYRKYQVSVTMSPRNLMAWLEIAYDIRSYPQAFKWVMLERYADISEKEAVKGFWATVFGKPL